MRRSLRLLIGTLVLLGCSNAGQQHRGASGADAGPPCIDLDHDGFGQNCPMGRDCNDHNPESTNECRACAHPDVGCPCTSGQQPISCFKPDQPMVGGNVMCSEGTRSCRSGVWGECQDIHSYVVTPDKSLTALINPDAAPVNCSICDVKCFIVSDPLTAVDGGPGSGVTYSTSGGLELGPGDAGTAMIDGGGDAGGLSGCAGLTACCTTLAGAPMAQGNCQLVAAGGNDPACNSALQLYCPNIISGPIGGCVIGGSAVDVDCDGIPDVLDECTPATVATNPRCNGSTLPLSTTNNQTIFHILDKGETGSNSLEVGFKVQNADVYFLMDMTGTMDQVSQKLKPAMKTGNFVECALLKNCCDRQSGATQTACMNVVNSDNQPNCQTAEATYCTGGNAQLVNCPDLDFDGAPDNYLKSQGVVGAIRCLVGSSWFGAGYFREISSIADTDEQAFRHVVDMSPDTTKVQNAIGNFYANSNPDYPEAQMVGLYSLLTGKGQMFGNQAVSVPERLGKGCAAGTFGYPCFRKDTIPIVVLFTDDVMHNGPPPVIAGGTPNGTAYAGSYALRGKAPTSGAAIYTPAQSEGFATAYNLGDVRNQFMIASGDLAYMAGDYPAAVTGCGAATSAPDAVYRFTVSSASVVDPLTGLLGLSLSPVNVQIGINTTIQGSYTNYGGFVNGPTPATNMPVVVSLFRGIPASVQQPVNVGDTRVNPIPSGPDLAYLTYLGTSSGQKSAQGLLGGISSCGADGKTNEVVFTFRPTVNAKIVIDSSESTFNNTVSLHQGLPGSLPANPSGGNQVTLIGATGNNNDTFSTARRVDGSDGQIDGDYVTYTGDMLSVQNTGSGSTYDLPAGKAGLDDYDDSVVSCGVTATGPDAVFRFDVGTARRVRIDTEGSNFKTVISLHDGPPPQSFIESPVTANGSVATTHRVGTMSGDTVTDTLYAERSDSMGTNALSDNIAPVCGGTATTTSKEAYYSFRLSTPTHLNLTASSRTFTAASGQAYNTPGAANEAVTSVSPPSGTPSSPLINEFVADHVGVDTHEFVEIYGQPNTDYSAYKILQIEGNSGFNLGLVNRAIVAGVTDASGLWVSAFYSNQLNDGTQTLLLVKDYTGSASTDIDTDNDGVIDAPPPWSAIVDAVAVNDGGGGDVTYGGAPVLTNSFDGGATVVGGASRIPSGRDTDKASDWLRNDFNGDGLPGMGYDPMVFLYSSAPGSVTTINAGDPNGDGNFSDSNTHNTATTALNLGDVFGQVDTKVINANLGDPHTTNDYPRGIVSCNGYPTNITAIAGNNITISLISGYTPKVGDLMIKGGSTLVSVAGTTTTFTVASGPALTTGPAVLYPGPEPPGYKDHVYKFTPSADGTVRINVATAGAAYHAVAIYDDAPPLTGAIGVTQLFDASKLGSAPDASCTAYSFDSNKGDANPAHVYWFCANARTWSTAETNCNVIGGHLVRLDDATENAFVGAHRTTTPAWIGGHDTPPSQWRWSDNNDQFWQGQASGSVVGGRYVSWRSGQPSGANQCVAYKSTSATDVNNWDGNACTGSYQYACEVSAPSPAPPESLASAYLPGSEVGAPGDLHGRVLAYTGSTRRMDDDINGLLMSTCGATQHAGDAVFKLTPAVSIQATIDTSGSAFPAIVGLFHSTIDAAGYMGCDAPGVAPNSDVTLGTTPASTVPLGGAAGVSLIGGQTYYAVVKGTAASPDGAYQIKFTDLGAGGNGVQIACSMENVSGPAAAQADFSANHTYYVIVESNQTAGNAYAMTAHSLYRARTQIENPLDQNEHGGTALSLVDPYRSKDTVVNTSTAGMAANFTTTGDTPGGLLSCGSSSASPDAVYKFTPSIATNVRVSAVMPGKQPVVALFEGRPGSSPTITNLAPGNTNEATSSAYQVDMSGPAQTLLGNTSNMTNDINGSLVSCGAAVDAHDATFRFSLAQQTQVQIDASASTGSGMMGDPVIALFHDYALEKPVAVTLENDSYTDADANPNPEAVASNNWLVYKADMADLTPASEGQVSVAATNTNEQVNPSTLIGAQDLGDVWNTKVTVGGGDTTVMQADYSAFSACGGDDNAPDAVYSFHSSQAGDVRISTAKPTPGFNTVIALFDGSTGAPLRKIDGATTVTNLNAPPGCGNHLLDWQEQCDDGNLVSGDGCDSTCHQENGIWRCPAVWYGTHDGCDCGCGLPDPDCLGNTSAASCAFCDPPVAGGCNATGSCPGTIMATDNTRCQPAVCGNGVLEAGEQCDDGNLLSGDGCDGTCHWQAGSWTCPLAYYGTHDGCDCGCGIPDPDCANGNVSSCGYCGDPGACSQGVCPSSVNPTNNAICTLFGGGSSSNANDAVDQAQDVDLSAGGAREYQGNTAGMAHNVDATQVQCGAVTTAPDAVYQFTLRKPTQVQIDATASANKPVLALFNAAALSVAPQVQSLAPDGPSDADLNPSPTPQIQGSWVRYAGDLANLTASSQPQTQINNQDNVNNDTPTELVDPNNRRDTVTNASTASMQATYPAPSCGGVDTANDALYRFVPSVSGQQVRISTNYPQTSMHTVVALYDGSNGYPPLQRSQMTSVTTAVGQSNESQPSAQGVPVDRGQTYIQTGTTAGMASDVPAAYIQQGGTQCGAAVGSADAVWSFSLSKQTDVMIDAQGSGYNTVLGLFDSPFIRPSVTQQASLADSITQLYDLNRLPSQPEPGCSPYDYNQHRYWFCSQKRPWDDARAKCQYAGSDLVVINDQTENDELLAQIAPTGESHHIGLRERTPYTSWGSPVGVWVDGSSPVGYQNWFANEPNQPADSTAARMRSQDGLWVDVPESWQSYRYVCEQNNQAALPLVPTATSPQVVDLLGATRHFLGSTTGIPSSVGNLIGCGATANAPDAAFRIDIPYTATVTVDFSNSFAGSVIGLFKGGIGAQGYLDAGSLCALVTAAAPQLQLTNLAAGTYYVVLTGATTASGSYDIVFNGSTTDPLAFTMENDKLIDATNNPIGDITNRWVVKRADMAHLTTDLITARTVDMPGVDTNSSHVAPYAAKDLGNTAGEQVTVVNAGLEGLSADYPAPSCGVSSATADAIYKFTPTRNASVRIGVSPVSFNAVIALYRGPDFPLLQSQTPAPPITLPNTNDAPIGSGANAAKDVGLVGDPLVYLGNVSTLGNDVPTVDAAGRTWDRSDLNGGDASNACNAAPAGKDAFFKFTATAGQSVVLDSSGSDFAHTLAVWRTTDPLTAPAAVTAQYDTRAAAPNLAIDNKWYVLQGNTTALMPAGDTKVVKTAGTDFQNDDATQNLGTLSANTQIVTSGADSSASAVHNKYDIATLTCGAAPAATDMIFKFHTGAAGGPTEIAISNPSPAFPPVLALFDGSGGRTPQSAASVNPVPTAVTGNDSRVNAYAVPALGTSAVAYSSNTMLFAADNQAAALYNQAALYGGATCSAGVASKDAFFKLTLAADAHVRIQTEAAYTAYPHTIAIYDQMPLTLPAPSTVQYNTFAAAAAAPTVTIDKNWVHYYTDMSPTASMSIDGVPETFVVAGTDFQNLAGVQDLNAAAGTISGKQLRTKAASSYAGGADTTYTGASYPGQSCIGGAGNATANDMIWKVRPTTATKLRVGVNNPTPGFSPVIAVYDGLPLTTAESASTTLDQGPTSNSNETFATAGAHATVNVGARTLVLGNESAMMSDYAGSQFQAFALNAAPLCNPAPAATGADAFVQLNVRTIPDTAFPFAQLWLDADDSTSLVIGTGVTTWNDKSGNGHNVNQGTGNKQPGLLAGSLNGRSGVDFDGVNDSLAATAITALSGDRSVFAVWKLKPGYAAAAPLLTTDSSAAGFAMQMSAAPGYLQYAGVTVDPTINDTSAVLVEASQAASTLTTYTNGTAGAPSALAPANYDIFRLGTNKAGSVFAPMTLYELVVFSKALSTSERQTVEGYLANKWGLAGNLPAGHPYKAAAPTRNVEISSASTTFASTLSFFNAVPMTQPATVAGPAYDTSDLALASSMGQANSNWMVRSSSTAGLHISELTQAAGTVAADGATQALGALNGKEVSVTAGGSGTTGFVGDYPKTCGTSDSAPDAIYLVTASSTTQARVALRNPNFTGDIALFEAPASAPTATPYTNGVLGLAAAATNLAAANESIASAQVVPSLYPITPSGGSYTGYAVGYTGDPVTNNVAGTAFQVASDLSQCNPDTSASGEDAFFRFTVPAGAQREIEINASGTGGAHTLALFNQDPGAPSKPIVTAGSFASNIDTTALSFAGAPSWTCSGGTITISSGTDVSGTGASISSTCSGVSATPFSIMTQPNPGPNVMVIKLAGLNLSAGETMTLKGALPVVFLVNGTVALGGGAGTTTISADTQGNGSSVLGAGGTYSNCGASVGNAGVADATADKGNGGGGGGAFRTPGATGGNGDNTGTGLGGAASTADTSSSAATLKPLRGGCKGGDGASTAATGGAGGGAFQISAAGGVTLSAGIVLSAAGGAGQKGSSQEDGGGGGGSGGAILFEGSAINDTAASFSTVSFTNGGGAASGNQTDATNGVSGQDGQRSTVQATGGSSTNGSGAGGKGGATAGAATAGSNGSPYSAGSYTKAITLDGSQVSAALSGFPALIKITSDANVKARALASGNDIYFLASDQVTPLAFQRESYDSTTGTLIAWVNIPTLASGSDTVIYLLYGDGLAHPDNKTAVWDASYFGVWHLSNSDFSDSTTNAHNAANSGTSDTPGQIGTGRVYTSGNNVSGGGNLGSTDRTFSVWVKMSTAGLSDAAPVEPITAGQNQLFNPAGSEIGIGSGGALGYYNGSAWVYSDASGTPANTRITIPSGSWAHVVQRVHAAASPNGYVEYSVNGSAFTRIYSGNTSGESTSGPVEFGCWVQGCSGALGYPSAFVGSLDEIHISTTLRPDAWGRTEYANQKTGSTFVKSIGAEVPPPTRNGAGGGGGGGGQGYSVKNVISSPIWQADTSVAALTGVSPGPFVAVDNDWTVKVADLTNMHAEWAVASTLFESAYPGVGETGSSPLVLGNVSSSRITIDGNSAARTSDHDEVCGTDGGADTVYTIAPTQTGKLRIKVSGNGISPAISSPIVAVYDHFYSGAFHSSCNLLACVTDNDSDTSQPGSQGKTDSNAASGTTTITDLQVTGGTTYYVVVKSGGGAIVNGHYNLELTWRDPEDWPTCSEDPYDGKDVWFAFTTAATVAAGGESYTIETGNSTADTAIALYKDTNGDHAYQAGEYQTCGDEINGSASITATVFPSTTYYVRVKQPTGGSSAGAVIFGVRDNAAVQNAMPVALACASGDNSAGGYAKIVRTLDPGTYYVGWKGGTGATHYTGAYQVNLRDDTNLPARPTQIGCAVASSGGVASVNATLQAGRNYYVLVKGDGASSNSGTYGLDVADTGAVPNMSCSGKTADPGAPDAYEAFTVSGSNKDVTVDFNGSTIDGVFELWKDNGASDIKLGCAATTGTSTTVAQQLAPGSYYVKLRSSSSVGNLGEQPFQVSVRDDDVQRASDCADGASGTGGILTKTLSAGTYYVGLKPQSGQSGSSYMLSVRDTVYSTSGGSEVAGSCSTAKTVDVSVAANHDYYVLVKGQTPADKGSYGLTLTDIGVLDTTAAPYDTRTDIGCGDLSAPDTYYEFTLTSAPKNVEIALTNAFDGAFQLYRDDGSFTNNDNIGACYSGVGATHAYALTTAGKYFLVVKGRTVAGGAAEQPAQVSIRDVDAQGSIACSDGNSGTPAFLQTSMLPSAVLNGSGQLKAGTYYVALSGQTGQDGPYGLMFNDQDQNAGTAAPVIECTASQAMTHTLAANTDYYAIVKGNGPPNQGPYTLSVTDGSGVQAIDPSCPTELAAPDGYVAFTLTSGPRDVRIDMSGSSLTGAFQVFNSATGTAVAGCGCSEISAPLTCNLAAGTYYAVYRGDNYAGGNAQRPFKLVLQDLSALGSLACADGPVGTGTLLTTPPLAAGTYYAGIIPTRTNSATSFNYRLSIKDSASAVVTSAPEAACSGTEIDTAVNANVPYYIVVKGKNVGDEGDYGLTVQDLSGVASFGCGDDTASGDAFYSFTVSNPAGSNVTVDSEGSTLQTVLALFPSSANFSQDDRNNTTSVCCSPVSAGAPTGACNPVVSCDGKPDQLIACDSNSGLGGTSLISGKHLGPGTYYVVVRGRLGAPNSKLPFVVSVRDDDGVPSSYCSATGSAPAQIRQVLQPGTYYAVLKGSSTAPTSGAYNLRFRDYGPFAKAATEIACNTASDTVVQTVTAGKPYYVVVKGDTAADRAPYKLTVENFQLTAGMGCNADPLSPDAFYRFSLAAPTAVSIDTSGSVADTVIALYNVGAAYFGTNYAPDVMGAAVSCNDDAPEATAVGAHWSKIRATLPAGSYYLEVKGAVGGGASWGAVSEAFNVSIRDEGANSNIACAPASAPTLTQNLPAGDYKLVVSDDGAGGAYDVRFKDLSAVATSATRVACDTANDTISYTVGANKPYYVIVKGDGAPSAKGAYTLSVESVDGNATSMGCGADPKAADAFFKFKVTQQTDVTIDTVGSQLDTVLALYPGNATAFGTTYAKDAFGQNINCDNDGGGGTDSKITATLAPGDYYAVVKGTSPAWGQTSLPFNLSVRDDSSTRAITCANAASGAQITQTLAAGSYVAVLSDTTPGTAGSGVGGAYSVTFKNVSTAGLETGVQKGCAVGTLDNGGAGVPVTAGKDYYVVVKGNATSDAGNYTLTVDDLVSGQAAAGSTAIACAGPGSSIDAVYPAGNYYAVVTGATGQNGGYELDVKDVDPFLDYNRIACDKDSGPNSTSTIEADLQPGPHYVVVKGDGSGQTGTYNLHVRDVTANPDNRIACADPSASNRLTANVTANTDYTVLLKGDEKLAQGNFNIKLYDELGLGSSGALKTCQVICPNVAPYNSCRPLNDTCSSAGQCCSGKCTSSKCSGTDPVGSQACASSQISSTSFTQSLAPDTYYMTVKGRRANENGFYELQVGDPTKGSTMAYVPPTWTDVRDAIVATGTKVLPVLSCDGTSQDGMCPQTTAQAKVLAQTSGAIDKATGQGLVQVIKPDGTGIGSKLALAVRDLANYLAMDITLSVVNNPGFQITIQKCTNSSDPSQAACKSFSLGCNDTSPVPKNTIAACQPGATPKFFVQFTNPLDPNAVPPNPADPNGGYHFALNLVGNKQFLLDEIPVYIIPTDHMGPPPAMPGSGMFQTSGSYEQQVYGAGCNYYQLEGEGSSQNSCNDNMDNNGNGKVDGLDDGCKPGSCLDGIDNDGDGKTDINDPDCQTNETQDWTDLFFNADIPPGTNLVFDMCTADTTAALASCSFSRVATVTSATGSCATNTDCKGLNVGGTLTDGFCGAGGQCQFISPQKMSGFCTSDAQCPNGSVGGQLVTSHCVSGVNQCQYTTPPADIGNHLMQGQNGKPYVRMRITLNANSDQSKSPTLYDWHLEYVCRGNN